ncbi:Dps family protein [Marinivivus vitaminiproducens]|uniref:Dps family protein n=1 Tax=Marinivivus vitaminiproducens TaxID=3035935 RepID=UPI00279C8438|nr:DNA starvation/stationary phase protection protein [Geminicoccaceae bacterium SCSIO 64248]
MKVDIGMKGQDREAVGQILNAVLADQHILYVKTRNYHWNVVGPQFKSLHELFEEQYTQLADSIDTVAERARALGVHANGTMAEFVRDARLKEEEGRGLDSATMVGNLVHDHESVVKQLRADIERCDDQLGDAGTADILTGILEDHDKMAWMLRSFLNEKSV